MWSNLQFPEDLVTFTEEIFNEKLSFLDCESKKLFFPHTAILDKIILRNLRIQIK